MDTERLHAVTDPTSQAALPYPDLAEIDAAVERAILAGGPIGLRVLGYGEITLVLGWPSEKPAMAVKRLPVFADQAHFDTYAELLERYLAALREREVGVVATGVRSVPAPAGGVHGYLVQPLVDAEQLLPNVLRSTDEATGVALLARIAETVVGAVDRDVGLDAQPPNWLVHEDRPVCFDVSTPFMRGPDGRDELDVSLFLSVYPWAVHPVLRRIARSILADYHDPRTVLIDFGANLLREDLARWLPALMEQANERLDTPIGIADVRRYARQDKLLWSSVQRLRRLDRSWQRRVRRRPYPSLLAPPYRYGPHREEGQ